MLKLREAVASVSRRDMTGLVVACDESAVHTLIGGCDVPNRCPLFVV